MPETLDEQMVAISHSRFLDPYDTRVRNVILSMYEGMKELQDEVKQLHNKVHELEVNGAIQ